ncbi:hypothetical protein CKSOR_00346 [Candidatus Kinetoplastibacterium sorsogonicusi]|uniref:Probable membrane transporter protein n=1 Tax=Candidatus Kinetoplastidibacterium kentomonadis TaxID=1576550 RepID=A0A3S7J9X7_9PROT|nr:sulfite exporter TauE/SafE family protein [Candidatus Kinetoplastibacterium sorsogonicusi]AWD32464.1 hypothetical protein CKSOR_00346 [Candidatus Kinetoplastibacterium sorsogonicusi]
MDTYFILHLLLLGGLTGFTSGLLGIGGGTLLVPLLNILFSLHGMPENILMHSSVATSMVSIFFNSLIGSFIHNNNNNIQWKFIYFMIPGIILGGIFSSTVIFSNINSSILSLIFSIFASYSGYKMLLNNPSIINYKIMNKEIIFIGVLIGTISGLIGVGGGFISIPFMVSRGINLNQAIATSSVLCLPTSLINTIGYIISKSNCSYQLPWMIGYIHYGALIVLVSIGLIAIPLGIRTSKALKTIFLKRLFAIILFTISLYMIINNIL